MSLKYTYTELFNAIQSWAEDDDPDYVAEIPSIIARAETRCLRDLDLEIFEQDLGIAISAGSRVVNKPTDAVHVNEVWVRNQADLKWREVPKRSFSYCRMFAPTESLTGTPEFFAENEEETITVVPTPDSTYTTANAKATCTIRPSGMSASNENTWLGDNMADMLFQASMIEAYDYLKHPAKLQEAAQKYQSLLPSVSKEIEDTIRRRYKGLNNERKGADN